MEGGLAMSFKENMERLQAIVDEFETVSPDIETSLGLFEEGVRIIKESREYLENAKRKVTVLSDDGFTEKDAEDERD
ncbi:MAG: exodeoxyribonuclease VII small subunit [Synergistaceae bacterium]|nr:exodeoxyribonuclease VII small subunit [Synergistaceae bacterium]